MKKSDEISDEMIKFELDNDLLITFLLGIVKVVKKVFRFLTCRCSECGRKYEFGSFGYGCGFKYGLCGRNKEIK